MERNEDEAAGDECHATRQRQLYPQEGWKQTFPPRHRTLLVEKTFSRRATLRWRMRRQALASSVGSTDARKSRARCFGVSVRRCEEPPGAVSRS